jgi:hypothetical protein
MPIALTDAQLDTIMRAATPLAPPDRRAFLAAVADALQGVVEIVSRKRATSSVFALVNEPVTQGFVASLARPGGNITGFTNMDFSVVGKMVELLNTMVPALKRIGLMFNSDTYPIYETYLRDLKTEQRGPLEVVRATVRSPADQPRDPHARCSPGERRGGPARRRLHG